MHVWVQPCPCPDAMYVFVCIVCISICLYTYGMYLPVCMYMRVYMYTYVLIVYICSAGISMYVCITCIFIYTYVLHVLCVCMYCLYCMHVHVYFKDVSQNTYIYIQIPAIHANTQVHSRYIQSPNLCICMYILINTCKYRMECLNTRKIHTCRFSDVGSKKSAFKSSDSSHL
jgi:hypothetical protein